MELFLHPFQNLSQSLIGLFLIISSLGVISLKKPVHASLSFLLTLLLLATLYVELGAEFIGVMQVLVYAGAILVIFMFVIILFQDAHSQIVKFRAKANKGLLILASLVFLLAVFFQLLALRNLTDKKAILEEGYGTVQALGETLYIDFFFPFEAVVFLFLVAMIGAFYIGKNNDRNKFTDVYSRVDRYFIAA